MKVISHRGFWQTNLEKNSIKAFEHSFASGFGTETDLRDQNEKIVISHDMATKESLDLHSFLEIYTKYKNDLPLALNIKSDGLQDNLISALNFFEIKEYFVFDMSVPDTLGYSKKGLRFFSRQSEYEPSPVLYDLCGGIWLDAFNSIWFDSSLILDHLKNNKQVAIVSSELHKRDPANLWEQLRANKIHELPGVILCTDIPDIAKSYFF